MRNFSQSFILYCWIKVTKTFKLINAFLRNFLKIIFPLLMKKKLQNYNLQFFETILNANDIINTIWTRIRFIVCDYRILIYIHTWDLSCTHCNKSYLQLDNFNYRMFDLRGIFKFWSSGNFEIVKFCLTKFLDKLSTNTLQSSSIVLRFLHKTVYNL